MDLFKLFGTVLVENKDAIDALAETADEAENTGKSADKIGDGFKKNGEITERKLSEIAKAANKATDEVKSEAEKLARSYEEAGDDSATAMKKAYADIEASAKKASDGSKKSGADMEKVFGMITKSGAAVVATITAIAAAMVALAESTREYRLEMGKLETAFTSAGHTTEEAAETYRTLYSILGETDRAVEASQHIAKLCANEKEMKAMTEACIGAFALFDDSLPIEGLMEAANETAKTGQLTGVLTDALNWAGSSEEEFQKKLDACNTERERAAIITEELIELYADSAESYKKNNEEIINATIAQEKLNAATAKWGEVAEPLATIWKEIQAFFISGAADFFNPFGYAVDSIIGTIETSEEAAARIEGLRSQIATLEEIPEVLWDAEMQNHYHSLTLALDEAEAEYEELAEAERKAAEEAEEAARKAANTVPEFKAITEQYVTDAMTLFETFATTYEGVYNKISGWFSPFEQAATSVKTNINEMMKAMQSQVEFNNAYTANLQALKEYGLGDLSEAFQSYGANGAAYAKTIVDAVEKAGGATTEKGQQIIQGFSEMNEKVAESQGELAQTMTLLDGEFETAVQDMADKYGIAIEDLDKSAEASAAAKNTFEAFLQSMNSQIPGILSTVTSFGQQITSSLQNGMGNINITVTKSLYSNDKPTLNIPGAKTGLDFVPYDDYLVYLHQGEAVLTKEEATAWRAGKEMGSGGDSGSGGGVTVNQYIEAVAQTPVELASATAAYFEQARWVT